MQDAGFLSFVSTFTVYPSAHITKGLFENKAWFISIEPTNGTFTRVPLANRI